MNSDVEGGPPLGPGLEFERIRRILKGIPESTGVRVGPGDDACILENGCVVSTDLSLECIHFRLDWISAKEAGYRAAAAGISDLAAMAAEPLGILASVAAPGDGSGAEALMEGVRELADVVGAPLLGGDLTRSPGPMLVDIVSIGRVTSPLLRSEARPGDELWVTGTLGGAAAATYLWKAGRSVPADLRTAFARPTPRIAEARWLASEGVRAGLDISDGLAGDAGHLAAASGVAVLLDQEGLPLHPGLPDGEFPGWPGAVDAALHGGEDYELLIAAPEGLIGPRVDAFHRRFDVSLSRVGWVVDGSGVTLRAEGIEVRRPRMAGGFDHFEGEGGA